MTYFNSILPTFPRSRRAVPFPGAQPGRATLGVAVLIAGCGSSGDSSTITVGNENTSDNALIKESASSTSTLHDVEHGNDADQRRPLERAHA